MKHHTVEEVSNVLYSLTEAVSVEIVYDFQDCSLNFPIPKNRSYRENDCGMNFHKTNEGNRQINVVS